MFQIYCCTFSNFILIIFHFKALYKHDRWVLFYFRIFHTTQQYFSWSVMLGWEKFFQHTVRTGNHRNHYSLPLNYFAVCKCYIPENVPLRALYVDDTDIYLVWCLIYVFVCVDDNTNTNDTISCRMSMLRVCMCRW